MAGIFGVLTAFTLLEAAPRIEGTFSTSPTAVTVTGNSAAAVAGGASVSAYSSKGLARKNTAAYDAARSASFKISGAAATTPSPAAAGSSAAAGRPAPSDGPSSVPASIGAAAASAADITISPTITAGNSKANCVTLAFYYGVLTQSVLNAATATTGQTYNCLETFANPMPTWSDWEQPWMFSTVGDNWDSWLAASSAHQVVMGMDLIPQSVSNNNDPLTWESACAAGDYDQRATTLARNLVSYGAGGIVIRLGIEANGSWEADYTGSSTTELHDWAQCFDNEVTAMRAVSGTHFLFVWNPNICTQDFALDQWYPGNSYVDIIGADAYDQDCGTLHTVSQEGWAAYADDSSANTPNDPNFPSLNNIEAFAVANGKPMSFPEWGIGAGLPDDAAYANHMGQMFSGDAFSFESYFDDGDDGIDTLGTKIPNATAEYKKYF